MFGYESLTRVVYVLLVIGFCAVISYMVWYNVRMKHKQQTLEGKNKHFGTEEGIAAAYEAVHEERLHHRH